MFVENLIVSTSSDFDEDDITVMSFMNIKYGYIRTEIVP